MANVNCPSYVQGFTARVTRLDVCGNPDFGECGYATSDGYIQVTATTNIEDPDEFKQKNANGRFLVNQRSRPLLNWIDLSMQFQRVDFELFEMITGADLATDDSSPGLSIGFDITEANFATASFALELWMGTSEEECDPSGLPYFGYILFPWVVEGSWGAEDVVVANDLINFTITGRTRGGTPWGVGPWDVVLDSTGTPSPLFDPIAADSHWIQRATQVAPPDDMCGCQPLSS